MIQEDIYNALINSEEVSSIVGNKIFPIRLPRDIELPAVVYQIQSIEPVVSMSGDSGIDNASVVISVWAKEYLQAHSLANAVRKALISTGLRIISEGSVDNEDSMTRSYGVDLNFKIWSRFYKGASPTPDEDGSKWEPDGDDHIKPKHSKKVFASHIDGALEDVLEDGKEFVRSKGSWVEFIKETAESIKTKLETLTGANRLDASAIKNIPEPDLSNLQPLNANLTGLSGLDDTAGLVKQTGVNTFTKDSTKKLTEIYRTTIAEATNSVVIEGLDGDDDVVYEITFFIVNNFNGQSAYSMLLNGDTDANYGYFLAYGFGTTMTVASATNQSSALIFNNIGAINATLNSKITIHAKSGVSRSINSKLVRNNGAETQDLLGLRSAIWSNTANNLTSISLTSDRATGIGVGSYITISTWR